MPEPTRRQLKTRLEESAVTLATAEQDWLGLEDLNKTGDASKTDRDAAWRSYQTAQVEANRRAFLLGRRDERDGII